jgi:hypothetical protein
MGTMKYRNSVFDSILVIVLALLVLAPRPVLAQREDVILLQVAGSQGDPLAGVRVELFLYRFEESRIRAIPAGSCRTGEGGRCQIVVKKDVRDQSGFYRGYLAVGSYGKRPVLWPGGELSMNVWLNEDDVVDVAGESGPYDWQEGAETPAVAAGKRFPAAKVAIVLVVLAIWLLLLWWKGRR